MRTVGTLTALGALSILLQIVWAPANEGAGPAGFAPLLLGVGMLLLAALIGLIAGPGAVRVAVLLGLASGALFALAVLLATTGGPGVGDSMSTNQLLAVAGTLVAMLAVITGWWAARPREASQGW